MTAETMPRPMPAVGDAAPDFTLPDETGASRSLRDERGRWVVLFFYPKDDTPGCTREACAFRDHHAELEAKDATVWGVSKLDSASKAAFRQKLGLPFTLLADERHEVAERYGTWVQKQNYGRTSWGVKRATFLINPQGSVAKVWPKVDPDGHAEDVLAALAEAQKER